MVVCPVKVIESLLNRAEENEVGDLDEVAKVPHEPVWG